MKKIVESEKYVLGTAFFGILFSRSQFFATNNFKLNLQSQLSLLYSLERVFRNKIYNDL